MKAVVQDRYGSPEAVLRVREVDDPVPGEGEVLVRVHATTVHPDVWHVVAGRPYVLRLVWAGLLRPKNPIPGTDLAGVVEAVGPGVVRFRPGDRVFGEAFVELAWRNGGSFAELAAVPEGSLARIPPDVPFESAATVPTAGVIALLNLQAGTLITEGDHVLVNGAGGGVGSLTVQLAKALGARVTGVDRTEKLDMIRALGADEVIDFTREDALGRGERYDLIFDVASNLSLRACEPALTPDGLYIFIGHDHFGAAQGRVLGSLPRALKIMLIDRHLRPRHLPKRSGLQVTKSEIMETLASQLADASFTPVIDSTYPLDGVAEAMNRLESERACGKILILPNG